MAGLKPCPGYKGQDCGSRTIGGQLCNICKSVKHRQEDRQR